MPEDGEDGAFRVMFICGQEVFTPTPGGKVMTAEAGAQFVLVTASL